MYGALHLCPSSSTTPASPVLCTAPEDANHSAAHADTVGHLRLPLHQYWCNKPIQASTDCHQHCFSITLNGGGCSTRNHWHSRRCQAGEAELSISRNVISVSGGYDRVGRFTGWAWISMSLLPVGQQTATSWLLLPMEPALHKPLGSNLSCGKGADGLGGVLLSCPFSSPGPNPGITHIPTALCKRQKNLHVKEI